jgi:hypothetical protein
MNALRPGIGQRKRQLTQLPGRGNWRHRRRGRAGPPRRPAAPPGQAARPRRHLAAGDAERASVTRRAQQLAHSRRPDPAAFAIIRQGIHKPPSMINRGTALCASPTRARCYECPARSATASQLPGRPGGRCIPSRNAATFVAFTCGFAGRASESPAVPGGPGAAGLLPGRSPAASRPRPGDRAATCRADAGGGVSVTFPQHLPVTKRAVITTACCCDRLCGKAVTGVCLAPGNFVLRGRAFTCGVRT